MLNGQKTQGKDLLSSVREEVCRLTSQRRMMSPGALLLLLPWLGGPVLGELSRDFSNCLEFFYNRSQPQGIMGAAYQPICQRHNNRYHFASLYHRDHRTPLYSAYTLGPADGGRPETPWMYEPQLANSHGGSEMMPFHGEPDQNVRDSQAVRQDYNMSGFTKGHLNPSMHQRTRDNRVATFTLTNIVPQKANSNNGPWSRLETQVLRNFKDFCTGPMFVITGVLPYKCDTRWINNRVSVPEYMWSAYCCPTYKSQIPQSHRHLFPTYAAVGRNDQNSGNEIVPVDMKAKRLVRGYDVKRMTLEDLEAILGQRLGMSIKLFAGQCQ